MSRTSQLAPMPIAIEAGWTVSCPWHGRVSVEWCRDCSFLQGTLEGPDPAVLCGFRHGAPLRRIPAGSRETRPPA